MKTRFLTIAFAALFPSLAFAQMQPSGHFTPGHAIKALNSTGSAAGDAGGANGGPPGVGLTELGITNTGLPLCVNSAPTTLPYYQMCLGSSSQSGGLISYEAKNGAPELALRIDVNGTFYSFPGVGNGNVVGPDSSTANAIPLFNGTGGTLLKNTGMVWSTSPTAIPLLSAKIENIFEDPAITVPSSLQLASVFPGLTNARWAFSKECTVADVGVNHDGICDAIYINVHSKGLGNTLGSLNDLGSAGIGLQIWSQADEANDYAVGANFQVSSAATTAKLNALELDLQPLPGATLVASFGLIVNSFVVPANAAILTGGVVGGGWSWGMLLGGVVANTGIGVGFNENANGSPIQSAFDCHNITMNKSCLYMANSGAAGANGQGVSWESTFPGVRGGYIYLDNSNNLTIESILDATELRLNTVAHQNIRFGGSMTNGFITMGTDTSNAILGYGGTGNNLLVQQNNITTMQLIAAAAPIANFTAMQLRVNNDSGLNLAPVSLGAADSGGTGFRALRVAN